MIKRKRTPDYAKRASIGFALAAVAFMGWIIWTTPEPYQDTDGAPNQPEQEFYYMDESGLMGYDDLFPPGHEYGKDGEIVESTPNVFQDKGAESGSYGDGGNSAFGEPTPVDEPPAFIIFLTAMSIILGIKK